MELLLAARLEWKKTFNRDREEAKIWKAKDINAIKEKLN